MSWLSEIDPFIVQGSIFKQCAFCDGVGEHLEGCEFERMARVIRELVGHIKEVKAWAEHAGFYLVEIDDIMLMQLCDKARDSWENMSEDTKELIGE